MWCAGIACAAADADRGAHSISGLGCMPSSLSEPFAALRGGDLPMRL